MNVQGAPGTAHGAYLINSLPVRLLDKLHGTQDSSHPVHPPTVESLTQASGAEVLSSLAHATDAQLALLHEALGFQLSDAQTRGVADPARVLINGERLPNFAYEQLAVLSDLVDVECAVRQNGPSLDAASALVTGGRLTDLCLARQRVFAAYREYRQACPNGPTPNGPRPPAEVQTGDQLDLAIHNLETTALTLARDAQSVRLQESMPGAAIGDQPFRAGEMKDEKAALRSMTIIKMASQLLAHYSAPEADVAARGALPPRWESDVVAESTQRDQLCDARTRIDGLRAALQPLAYDVRCGPLMRLIDTLENFFRFEVEALSSHDLAAQPWEQGGRARFVQEAQQGFQRAFEAIDDAINTDPPVWHAVYTQYRHVRDAMPCLFDLPPAGLDSPVAAFARDVRGFSVQSPVALDSRHAQREAKAASVLNGEQVRNVFMHGCDPAAPPSPPPPTTQSLPATPRFPASPHKSY